MRGSFIENCPFLMLALICRKISDSRSPSPMISFIVVQLPGGFAWNPPPLVCDRLSPTFTYVNGILRYRPAHAVAGKDRPHVHSHIGRRRRPADDERRRAAQLGRSETIRDSPES